VNIWTRTLIDSGKFSPVGFSSAPSVIILRGTVSAGASFIGF
jgi:hypothetical protein